MSSYGEPITYRINRVLDAKSQRASRFLPYLNHSRLLPINQKSKHKKTLSKQPLETHVRRYDNNQSTTILSIRFASCEASTPRNQDQQMFIKHKRISENAQKQYEQNQNTKILPHIRYKKYESPEQYLKNMGYNSDVRISSQIYSDKIQQRKNKYLNKMDALKRQLQNNTVQKRSNRMQRNRIQIKILGQEIRRKRQRQLLFKQQRKGQRMFTSLLNSQNQIAA